MKATGCLTLLLLLIIGCALATVNAATLADQCTGDFDKVVACLSFATGKAATPTKECCSSVDQIKSKDPVCLCYFMQQTLKGNEQVKSLGIQSDLLLQLPSACKLTNASISYCPKLLNIPPNSPDYKIFTNVSSAPPTPATGASLPSTTTSTKSSGHQFGPQFAGLIVPIVIVMAILLPI